jgi:hypothetical protein
MLGNNKNLKNTTPSHPPPKEKTLGPLNACWLTSLVAKNFYAYVL